MALACIVVSRAAEPQLKPKLDPKSDKAFFGPPFPADYPDDYQLKPTHLSKDFTHPYPSVQESADYDKDYVKDENNDNGEWMAQYEYDQLRMKLRKEQKKVGGIAQKVHAKEADRDRAKQDSDAAQGEYKKAMDEEDALKRKVDAAEKKMKDAEKEKADADTELSEAEKKAAEADIPMKDLVKIKTDLVWKKIKHLEECKQELVQAKKELEEAIAQHQAEASKLNADLSEKTAEAQNKKASTAKQMSDAKSVEKGVNDELVAAVAKTNAAKDVLATANERLKETQANLDKEEAFLHRTEDDQSHLMAKLKDAEERLVKFRGGQTVAGGDHEHKQNSGSSKVAPSIVLVFLLGSVGIACLN